MSLRVTGVRQGWLWDKVKFTAEEKHLARFGSVFGDKVFWIGKDNSVTLRMSKNDMWEVGDKTEDLTSIITMHNQDKFNWKWA